MNKLLIAFLLVCASNAIAQKVYETEAETCHYKFIFEDKEQYIKYESNDSIMVVDFLAGLEEKQVNKLKGVILMQIMIDTAQQVCCVTYMNKTNLTDKKLDIVNRLKKMNGWKRLAAGLENENLCALIHIYFNKYDYKIQHIGYNRNSGKTLLESAVYKRFASDTTVVESK